MGDYSSAAEFYDLLYSSEKDYPAEAELLRAIIHEQAPRATRILDVGCGTGSHARALLDLGFDVDGVDIEPAFVSTARNKCPEGSFWVSDMRALALDGRYDAVLCLFSAIGYVRDLGALATTLERFHAHLNPRGVIVVDPWFEPSQMTNGWISTLLGGNEETKVCRMSRTVIQDRISRLEFEYLIGTANGLERRSEVHELGLFTQAEMEKAFRATGLQVERRPEALRTRGLYVGRR